jgi:hypothetical protein
MQNKMYAEFTPKEQEAFMNKLTNDPKKKLFEVKVEWAREERASKLRKDIKT